MTGSTGVETATPRLDLTVTARADTTAVAVLQAVADPIRWTVLSALSRGPQCVCRLQEHVPVAGNLLSYHLKVLRESGLVTATRRGRWIDYALAEDAPARMAAALPCAATLVTAGTLSG